MGGREKLTKYNKVLKLDRSVTSSNQGCIAGAVSTCFKDKCEGYVLRVQ